MTTLRDLIARIADTINWDTSTGTFSIILPLQGNAEYNYSTRHNNDKRNEIWILLGPTYSVVKKGHLRTVYCAIPREFVIPEMEKYRDHRDPVMYKFWLPERMFNSILHDHPVDVNAMVDLARNMYLCEGFEWDGWEVFDTKREAWNMKEDV